MKYILHTIVIALTFGFFTFASAQEVQTITVGNETVTYTETFDDLENATSYYNEDALVLTVFDKDDNGEADAWVLYREDRSVIKEMSDSDGDGEPDIFFELDTDENVTKSSGDGLKQYEIPEVVVSTEETDVVDTISGEDVDYAGDLTDIKKLAGEGGSFWTWVIVLLIAGVGYRIWKKKK